MDRHEQEKKRLKLQNAFASAFIYVFFVYSLI